MNVFEEGIRRGYEPMKDKGPRVGFEKGRVGRVKVKPSELAAYNLYKTLEKYPEFTKEARSQIQEYYKHMEGLETMNLAAFASVLTFLKFYPEPKPEHFKDEIILQYFTTLMPNKKISEAEKKKIIIKLKAQFLKYIVAINTYKAGKEEMMEIEEEEEQPKYGVEQYEEEDYEEADEYSE